MSEEQEKTINELSQEEVIELMRLTEADKWANGWRAVPAIVMAAILFLGPACIHVGYHLGADKWLYWPEGATLLKYTAMAGYIALAILFSWHMSKLARGVEERLDEVERHIEYRATAAAGTEAIWAGLITWGFALWFPQFYVAITAMVPMLVLFRFYLAYFGVRMKLRHELKA